MSGIYHSKDSGFSFSKNAESKLYKGTSNNFDFRKDSPTGIYRPSRNSFDFQRSGNPREAKAAGGAVTQPAMPKGPNSQMQTDSRNANNLPFRNF